MAVGLPVAIGVGDQVRQQPGQQGHVPVYQQVRLGMHRQRGALRGQMGLLLTEDLHQLAQVRRFQLELLRTLLQPGDVQQLFLVAAVQLFAQIADVYVHHIGVSGVVIVPEVVFDLLPGEDDALVADQILQQGVFPGGAAQLGLILGKQKAHRGIPPLL